MIGKHIRWFCIQMFYYLVCTPYTVHGNVYTKIIECHSTFFRSGSFFCEKTVITSYLKKLFCMKVIINLVLARDYALGQIQHIPEMAFIWSLICMDLHMPNKIGMSKSEYESSFKWCHIRSSL